MLEDNPSLLKKFHVTGYVLVLCGIALVISYLSSSSYHEGVDAFFVLFIILPPIFLLGRQYVRFRSEQMTRVAKIALFLTWLDLFLFVIQLVIQFIFPDGTLGVGEIIEGIAVIGFLITIPFTVILGFRCGRYKRNIVN